MSTSVTDAFNKQLAQRRANILNMFKNPQDAIDDDNVIKAKDDEEIDEPEYNEEDDEETEKGCGDGDIEKEESAEEDEVEETEDEPEDDTEDKENNEKTETEKAEIISLIGIDQLDEWNDRINEIAENPYLSETEKAERIDIIKGEINDFAEDNEVEKSDILYALSGYESKIKFRKTGKEIKEQLTSVVIPAMNSNLAVAQAEADECLKECGDAPTHDVPEYWTGELHIELPYKFYEWDETRVPENNSTGIVSSFSPESYKQRCCKNAPATQEEAEARCKYNEQVRKIANITTDIKACEIVSKNLKDNESVELSVRQLVAFKFA